MQVDWYVTAGCEVTACRWTGMLQLGVRSRHAGGLVCYSWVRGHGMQVDWYGTA